MADVAVISGSGLYDLFRGKERKVRTEFGEVEVGMSKVGGKEVVFLQRHGRNHAMPPHAINYKANILALRGVGVRKVIGVSACGAIARYKPGDIVLVDDFIGFHLGPITYFTEEFDASSHHKDFTQPYDPELKDAIMRAARRRGIRVKGGGVLVGTFGPRLETKAEIRAFRKMGANLVGMTSIYETILAKELDMGYCCIAVVSNYAAGVKGSRPNFQEVVETMDEKKEELKELLEEAVGLI